MGKNTTYCVEMARRINPIFLIVSISLMLLWNCEKKKSSSEVDEPDPKPSPTSPGVSGRLIIIHNVVHRPEELRVEGEALLMIRPNVTHAQAVKVLSNFSTTPVKHVEGSPYYLVEKKQIKSEWVGPFSQLAMGPPTAEVDQKVEDIREETANFIEKLRSLDSEFLVAVPNYVRYPSQRERPVHNAFQWALTDLGIPDLWDEFGISGKDIVIAVIDTGVKTKHPNLQENIDPRGYDFVSDASRARDGNGRDPNPDDPTDLSGTGSSYHGTHVAGIAAAYLSEIEIDGVAPGAKILPIRALAWDGGTDFDVAHSILYAAGLLEVDVNDDRRILDPPADIINMSLGGAGESPILEDAIERATAAGTIVIAAAGNESTDRESFPASYPQVISVGALGPDFQYADYSNYGPNVDVMAPGGGRYHDEDENDDGILDGILSTVWDSSDQAASDYMSGTSMAAPHLAGIVAMLLEGTPALNQVDVRKLIFENASLDGLKKKCQVRRTNRCGRGQLNVKSLLITAEQEYSPSLAKIEITQSQSEVLLSSTHPTDRLEIKNIGEGSLEVLDGEIHIRPVTPNWLSVKSSTNDQGIILTFEADPSRLTGRVQESKSVAIVTNAKEISFKDQNGNTRLSQNGVLHFHVDYQAGQTFIVALVKADSSQRAAVAKDRTSKVNGYQYHLTPPEEGAYFIYAGRDEDQDNVICEIGELCGTYGSLKAPGKIEFKEGEAISNIDFNVTQNDLSGISIETSSAQGVK